MPTYEYQDEDGDPVYRVVRRGDGPNKHFHQERKNGRGWVPGLAGTTPVPYHMPLILQSIEEGSSEIWVVEGEKDADNARAAYDIVTTTNSGGAGKWTDELSRYLVGAEVVYIVYDLDAKGREHAWKVHDSLKRCGVQDVRFRCSAVGNDITDHITAGYQLSDLLKRRPKRIETKEIIAKTESQTEDEFLPGTFQAALMKLNKVTPDRSSPYEHQYNACCPAHDDNSPSMTIRPGVPGEDSVKVLVNCYAGCSAHDIAVALGINPKEFTEIEQAEETRLDEIRRKALERIEVNEWARRENARNKLNAEPVSWSDARSGLDELAIPLEPVEYLVDGWFAYGSLTMMIADAKAGKTRLCLNLMQSLTEEQPFLGQYDTSMAAGSTVLYLNYDMDENRFRTWLKDYKWLKPERFLVHHLLPGQFNFWEGDRFDAFVEYAMSKNVQTLIIDTFAMASQGFVTDENNNTEVAAFCAEVRKLKMAASIPNVLMLHHRGRAKDEHGRGASSMDASVDALWFLRMDDREDHESPRFLRAIGRDVGQGAIQLVYDEATELYTTDGKHVGKTSGSGSGLSGRGRVVKLSKFAAYCRAIKVYYDENGKWPRGNVAKKMMPGDSNLKAQMRDEALAEGLVEHVIVNNRSYEVRLTELGLTAVNSDGS